MLLHFNFTSLCKEDFKYINIICNRNDLESYSYLYYLLYLYSLFFHCKYQQKSKFAYKSMIEKGKLKK